MTISCRVAGPLGILGLLGAGLGLRRLFTVVVVEGLSMEPTLKAGDRALVRRTHSAKPGHLVVASAPALGQTWEVAAPPGLPRRWLVKRLVSVSSAGAELHGDNAALSWDSRQWGLCPADQMVGVVVAVLSAGAPAR